MTGMEETAGHCDSKLEDISEEDVEDTLDDNVIFPSNWLIQMSVIEISDKEELVGTGLILVDCSLTPLLEYIKGYIGFSFPKYLDD